MARRTLLIIASILLAALGTALIWLYVQGAENRAQQNPELVPALFLTQNVPVWAVTRKVRDPAGGAAGGGRERGDRIPELGTQRSRSRG